MTAHPDHVLTVTVEGRATDGVRDVSVYRCSCGQFSYASPFPDEERVAEWHGDHVLEMTS